MFTISQLDTYSKLYFTPSFNDVEEYESASTSSNDEISDDESSDDEEEEQGMAVTSNRNDEEGAEVSVNEGNSNYYGSRNYESTVQLENTSGKYIKKMLKFPLDELKMRKTEQEAFSVTMDYPMKIIED